MLVLFMLCLQLSQQCEDRSVLRYVYYYLARILSDTGSQGVSTGGGIPTPNWDALADIDAIGGVTRADVVPRIVAQLTTEATNVDLECELISDSTSFLAIHPFYVLCFTCFSSSSFLFFSSCQEIASFEGSYVCPVKQF